MMDDRTEHEVLARLDRIERYLAHLGQVSGYPYSEFSALEPVPPHLIALARLGKVSQAVKRYREITGASLADAKAAIDQVMPG